MIILIRENLIGSRFKSRNTSNGGVFVNVYDNDFWNALDELVCSSEIVIDRPRGSVHPKYPDFIEVLY